MGQSDLKNLFLRVIEQSLNKQYIINAVEAVSVRLSHHRSRPVLYCPRPGKDITKCFYKTPDLGKHHRDKKFSATYFLLFIPEGKL